MRGLRVVAFVSLLAAAVSPVEAQNLYTWTGAEATMNERLVRDGFPSVAGVPKTFPGTLPDFVSYVTFGYTNTSAASESFTAEFLGETGGNLPFFSLYLGAFNPLDLLQNYLGDSGFSCLGTPCSESTLFSVDVAAGASVVLVANSASSVPQAGATFTWNGPSQAFAPSTSVPEPATAALMLVGLVGFAARRRRTA